MTSREVPPDKAIAILEEGQRELTQLIDAMPPQALERSVGIGDWSVKDLLGHIATWEELAVLTFEEWTLRKPLTVQKIIGTHGGVDKFNAEETERHRTSGTNEVLERAAKVHSELLAKIDSVDADVWNEAPYFETKRPPKSFGGTIGAITGGKLRGDFGHAFDHLGELRTLAESSSA